MQPDNRVTADRLWVALTLQAEATRALQAIAADAPFPCVSHSDAVAISSAALLLLAEDRAALKAAAEKATAVTPGSAPSPTKARRKGGWTPEHRQAAAERMRAVNAARLARIRASSNLQSTTNEDAAAPAAFVPPVQIPAFTDPAPGLMPEPAPVSPPPSPSPTSLPEPPQEGATAAPEVYSAIAVAARKPRTQADDWIDARTLLEAGMSVVYVAEELDLPKGQVSDLKFRIDQERASNRVARPA
jgi:hypothetical protein